ncbi:Uncharacterised protein [Mycobacteroides abscessus subsp. massiliense]|nr:Uncharacterised protein [Mycobacteroides abscessus subsp. massiliense]
MNLQVLGRVGVHHLDARVDVVDKHDPGLRAGQRSADAFGVHCSRQLRGGLLDHRVGKCRTVGDQDAGRQHIVFGLADQVRGHMHRIGGLVGENRDLGGAGLRVDAHQRSAQPLGSGHIDVSGPGDHVDRCELCPIGIGAAVRQQRHALCAADRPDLFDTEQPRRRQNGRMRQTAELRLGRRRYDERSHSRRLRGHNVHHDARWVHGVAPGHVKAHSLDRYPPLGHRRAVGDRGHGVLAALIGVYGPGAQNRHLERVAHGGVEIGKGTVQLSHGNPDGAGTDTIELGTEIQCGLCATVTNCLYDGPHPR